MQKILDLIAYAGTIDSNDDITRTVVGHDLIWLCLAMLDVVNTVEESTLPLYGVIIKHIPTPDSVGGIAKCDLRPTQVYMPVFMDMDDTLSITPIAVFGVMCFDLYEITYRLFNVDPITIFFSEWLMDKGFFELLSVAAYSKLPKHEVYVSVFVYNFCMSVLEDPSNQITTATDSEIVQRLFYEDWLRQKDITTINDVDEVVPLFGDKLMYTPFAAKYNAYQSYTISSFWSGFFMKQFKRLVDTINEAALLPGDATLH